MQKKRTKEKRHMTKEEFTKKYCFLCGTQRCCGIDDEEFRQGCKWFKKFKGELTKNNKT